MVEARREGVHGHATNPRGRREGAAGAAAVSIEARVSGPRGKVCMVKILITCPNTGEPVAIGKTADERSFRNNQKAGDTFGPCPLCGEMHAWRKRDAYLAGAKRDATKAE